MFYKTCKAQGQGQGQGLGLGLGVRVTGQGQLLVSGLGRGYAIDPHRIFIKARTMLLLIYQQTIINHNFSLIMYKMTHDSSTTRIIITLKKNNEATFEVNGKTRYHFLRQVVYIRQSAYDHTQTRPMPKKIIFRFLNDVNVSQKHSQNDVNTCITNVYASNSLHRTYNCYFQFSPFNSVLVRCGKYQCVRFPLREHQRV